MLVKTLKLIPNFNSEFIVAQTYPDNRQVVGMPIMLRRSQVMHLMYPPTVTFLDYPVSKNQTFKK